MNENKPKPNGKRGTQRGIAAIAISGYKSICEKQRIELRPLTLLAGANSSGKSSAIQPLLLLKQTLEETLDSGALKLGGPNIRFSSATQLLSRTAAKKCAEVFSIEIEGIKRWKLRIAFKPKKKMGFEISQMAYEDQEENFVLHEGMTHNDIVSFLHKDLVSLSDHFSKRTGKKVQWGVIRDRCFLWLYLKGAEEIYPRIMSPAGQVEMSIRGLIHLPGLRGNPERTYPRTAFGPYFPGEFQGYTASIIRQWKLTEDVRLKMLGQWLQKLGLTWKVESADIDDIQVELEVGRLTHAAKSGAMDLVNIADVGVGVSQVLPVAVALLVAEPTQIVYLEQPEIHLHPKAQVAMAELLADAAKRGVIVIAETHSWAILQGIQALAAERKLKPDLIKLHWFVRGDDGFTKITSRDLDESGAFGDWPEDFGQVSLDVQSRILDAGLFK